MLNIILFITLIYKIENQEQKIEFVVKYLINGQKSQ